MTTNLGVSPSLDGAFVNFLCRARLLRGFHATCDLEISPSKARSDQLDECTLLIGMGQFQTLNSVERDLFTDSA